MARPAPSVLFVTSTRIGDAILSTGLLNAVLERYPQAGITIACGEPAAPLFEAVPRLERILVIRKRPGMGHWIDLWRACIGRRWHAVIDLRRSLIRWLLWTEQRYGQPKPSEPGHRVALIARTLGLPPQPPRLWISENHRQKADALLGGSGIGQPGPVLAVAPGANWAGKIWPPERFATLALQLTAPGAPLAGARIAVSGSAGEADFARPLLDAFPAERIVNGLGLSLPETYALFQRCRMFVGNDSGLMHLAAATGNPTVGLFGPTRDDLYAPWGENGLVVRTPESIPELIGHADYDHRATGTMMGGLSVEAVLDGIRGKWPDLAPSTAAPTVAVAATPARRLE